MIPKDIDKITEADLQALIDNTVPEGKTIEYKQGLPGNSDSDKKEFLADVSSFANTTGGDLIFGINEDPDTRAPIELTGLDIQNIDQEIGRLDSMIRDGVEPRMPGLVIKPYGLSNSRTVLIIKITKSWISPHRVTYKGHDKFYARSSNGKYPLDVSELRIAFNLSETLAERIRKFREERISKIYANDMPVSLTDGAKVVLHLIPLNAFNLAQRYDLSRITSNNTCPSPIYCYGWNNRYNFDGYLTYSELVEGKYYSYTQLFNNGIIEAVGSSLFAIHGNKRYIPSVGFESELIKSARGYISVLKTLGADMPIILFITLLGVKGYSMSADLTKTMIHISKAGISPIDRNILLLPEIAIDNYENDVANTLLPCFDALWNACGFPKSPNYNAAGEWKPQQ